MSAIKVFCSTLWELDVSLSRFLSSFANLREPFKLIEWGLHGVPWLAGSSLLLITSYGRQWDEVVQYRLAILTTGLIVDLLTTGVIKLSVQRPRPKENVDDIVYGAPIADEFSFPSGHTSRITMLTTLWSCFYPRHSIFVWWLPLVVGTSRVVMGRHYVSDVLSGIFIGYAQAKIILLLPMSFNLWLRKILR